MATNFNPRVATIDELRDWLAVKGGYRPHTLRADGGECYEVEKHGWLDKGGIFSERHPVPATIDAAAALMPEGWMWERDNDGWSASSDDPDTETRTYVCTSGTDELTARLRLAALAIQEMEKR